MFRILPSSIPVPSYLHGDKALWYQLSDNGLAFATEQFSLEAVSSRLSALLAGLGILD